jgi:hypothetical protein
MVLGQTVSVVVNLWRVKKDIHAESLYYVYHARPASPELKLFLNSNRDVDTAWFNK